MSTEIVEAIDAELKSAGVTEITSDLVTVEGKKPETQVSSLEETKEVVLPERGNVFCLYDQTMLNLNFISEPEITEGDVFFALATFVSETGEAMNLVEGEKVHVLEWNNADWWYVRKHLTEESGWVPAQYLKDELTYTHYVQKKLVEKIEKLPVFDSKN